MAEVSPAEMQECSHAAAGAVAAVPSHRGTAAALALLLRQHGPPSPQTHVWSPQALLRVPWWHALRQQPPLDLSQGSGKRHLVHTSHQRRGSELSPPVSKGQCWGHPSEGAGGSRLGQAACAGAGPRQRCLSTAPIYFCEPWPWRSPEAAAQHGGRLGLLHALPDAGTRPKAGAREC